MLKISTFNIQNDFNNYDISKSEMIKKYVLDNDLDILGLQELFSKCNNDLEKLFLDSDYNLFGKYRFLLKKILNRFNEKNAILTKNWVFDTATYHLPFFPSPLKRIVTKIVISYKNKKISIYNTHLDYKSDKIKKKQLERLVEIISGDSNLIILMGDFNLKNNNPLFNDFIKMMEDKGLLRVELGEKTLKASKYKREIDHIFLSKEFKLLDKKVVKELEISDHYPVKICVEL